MLFSRIVPRFFGAFEFPPDIIVFNKENPHCVLLFKPFPQFVDKAFYPIFAVLCKTVNRT
jgi:hypothetical protein